MSNILTDWRTALVTHLKANLQAGAWADDGQYVHVKSGERDEPVKDRKLAVVFAPPFETNSGNINFANPAMIIRAWLPRSKQPRAQTPMDPEPLEQLMLDITISLQPVQQTLLPDSLYFWVQTARTDEKDWGVELGLTGWALNPATIAGTGG